MNSWASSKEIFPYSMIVHIAVMCANSMSHFFVEVDFDIICIRSFSGRKKNCQEWHGESLTGTESGFSREIEPGAGSHDDGAGKSEI